MEGASKLDLTKDWENLFEFVNSESCDVTDEESSKLLSQLLELTS